MIEISYCTSLSSVNKVGLMINSLAVSVCVFVF
jgi:hypothetical protein